MRCIQMNKKCNFAGMKKNRWLPVIGLSIMSVIVILLLLVLLDAVTEMYYHQKRYVNKGVLERIIGVEMPPYHILERSTHRTHGPHYYDTTLEFDEIPGKDFYDQLKERGDCYVEKNDSVVTIHFNEEYRFLTIFGFYGHWINGDAYITFRDNDKAFDVKLFEWPSLNENNLKSKDD